MMNVLHPIAIPYYPGDVSITCYSCGKTFHNVRIVLIRTSLSDAYGNSIDKVLDFHPDDVCACLADEWLSLMPFISVNTKTITKGHILN